MKNKILTVALAVALAFTIVFASFSVYATGNIQIGDANGDGVIDLMDVTHLAQYIAGWDVKLGESEPSVSEPDTPITPTGVNFNNDNEANYLSTLPTRAEVHILMWRKWMPYEQELIDNYMINTGVNVKTTVTTESEYSTKLVSMISNGESPDIIRFSANDFPGLVTKALQPLTESKFHLSADCWNKKYMDAYKVNNYYFGVAMPKTWNCEDLTYVTYYSPQVLKNCGVTTMPWELYKQGNWDWEAQNQIATKVKNKGFVGLSVQSFDMFMHSAGTDFASYDGGKFTNNLGSVTSSDLLSKSWMEAATLKQEDVFTGWDLNNVQQGKVGLFTAISYGLNSQGNWFQGSFAKNLEVVPVAGPKSSNAYTPVRPSCWGIPKKAPNVEGAAYFLRYFLDVSNYDQSTTFHNDQFEEVFNLITSSTARKSIMYGSGVSDYVESGVYSMICNALVATTPQNIATQLNSKKGYVQTGITRANKDLERIK